MTVAPPSPPLSVASAKLMQPGDVLKCHVVKGLQLRRTVGGYSWLLYYRAKTGEQRRPKLGDYPALSLEAARAAARALLAQIAAGHDPSQDWQTARHAPTVADLAAIYMREHARRHKAKRSADDDDRALARYVLPVLGSKRVADVTRSDINGLLDAVHERRILGVPEKGPNAVLATAPAAANRTRALLSKMFSVAEDDGTALRPVGSNPVRGAVRFREFQRRRHALPAEMPALARELDKLGERYPAHVAAVYVLLLSGARVSEIVTARRADRDGARLVLHRHKTDKTGVPRVIRLPAQATAILDGMATGGGDLFAGVSRRNLWGVFDTARKAAGCSDLRLQDLRRTFASVAKSNGVSLDQIGELFTHASTATTARYAWLYDDAATEAAQGVADAIDGLMQRKR